MNRIRSATLATIAGLALSFGSATSAQAQLINFDDLTGRGNFFNDGIQSTYQGYTWGTSLFTAQTGPTGWGYGSVGSIATSDPIPVSAPMMGWTWNGPQSLFINFLGPKDVQSAWFASLYPLGDANGSNSLTMYGYDAAGNVVATSSTLALTNSMQQINSNFTSVYALELRSDRNFSWFTVDDIQLNRATTVVPEPGTWALMLAGLAMTGVAARRRRKA